MGYGNAIKRPFADIGKLVIGIVIMLIPIVNFIGVGYFLQCAKMTFKRNNKMPDWTGWGGLFITGIVAAIIGLIWMIPAFLVAFAVIGSILMSAAPMLAAGDTAGAMAAIMASIGTLMIGIIITAIVWIIFALLGVAAVLRYAEKGNFGAGFDFNTIRAKAFRGNFIAAWIVGTVYLLVLTVILSYIPFIGSAIAAFIGGVAYYTMLAEAYVKKK